MKKKLTMTLIVIAIVAETAAGALNPLRKPEEKIRQALLQKTPLGMPKSEVRRILQTKRWLDRTSIRGQVSTP
jgi:hypothetical protein